MKLILCLQINIKGFFKLILSFQVCVWLLIMPKHTHMHESLLQIYDMILMGMVKQSQNSKFAMSLQYLKREIRDEVGFLHADKHQLFLQVNFHTLGIKVSCKVILSLLMGTIKHSESTQSNKFVISSQYLKKEDSHKGPSIKYVHTIQ